MWCLSDFGFHFQEGNFDELGEKKDDLDVFAPKTDMKRPSRTEKVLCPICWTELTTEQKQTLMNNIEPNWYIRAPMQQVNIYQEKIRSRYFSCS